MEELLEPRREALVVGAACALLVLLASLEAARQTYPYFDDVTYLHLGNQVRALGGPLGLLRALFAGTFEEANRHPLYLALLGLIARPVPAYHREAQALTIGLGVIALLSCWWTARRNLGRAPAAVLILMLAASRTLISCSARECCEPLLVAVWAQAVGAVWDGVGPSGSASRWAWLRAGAWSGLAYLTKGTGMFLPVSLALTFLLQERLRAVLDLRAWSYGAAFLATSSPLIVRNLRAFGSPFYNFNLPMLWQDRLPDFAEFFAPQARHLLPHGFLDYLRHLTLRALGERVAVGLGETTFLLAEAMAPSGGSPHRPFFLAVFVLAIAAGAAAVVIALRWIARNTRGFLRTFLLVHTGWTYFFIFLFSVNGGNTRYFLPLATTVLAPALAARVCDDLRAAGSLRRSRWARTAAAALVASLAAALVFHGPTLWKPGMEEVRDWMSRHLRRGDAYAVDARSHLQLQWVAPQATQLIVSASWREKPVDTDLLLRYLQEKEVRFIVLDASSEANLASAGDPAGRRYLFYDRMPLDPDGSLPLRGIPPGLRLAYEDPSSPRRWLVLETAWGAASRK